ncbi:imidazolonepropionase [Natrarchaeobius oligotrophus]|uniref:Imidazolonepropionase n=1 Tax=Natrarchaeobius chitinivorans TaxID=1679083 RepID=A0A3N6MWU4_NATCH|nr:imidazolonepropionase [Natrarchaeobius chitinivorans]RQH02471.1 imidazolonepropionase [Natrarchaeobius chitinivorans]
MTDLQLVVHDASEVAAVRDGDGSSASSGLEPIDDGAVAVVDGEIEAVGDSGAITREYPPENAETAIDATGRTVQPGFVDPHTHAVFAGDRSDEFEAKLQGKSYQEIMAEGGGILRTVRATREADDETLLANLLDHLDVMLAHGSTTVEVKSGYGLDAETELRMLEAIERADERHPIDLVATYMGAHAVPEGSDADEYVDEVIDEQLPTVADQGIAEFCDVFCEEDVFSVEQSRRILEAGRAHGLAPKVHAEEFVHLGGTQLAADVGATSADHLLHATTDDVRALIDAGTVPVLLPGTAFGLRTEYADARGMLEEGAPVALATDFNPNCYSHSMGYATTLACVGMRMTPAEALVAATRTAAAAIDRPDGPGRLEVGAPADLCVLDAPSHVHVPYSFGVNRVDTVVKDGEVVHE